MEICIENVVFGYMFIQRFLLILHYFLLPKVLKIKVYFPVIEGDMGETSLAKHELQNCKMYKFVYHADFMLLVTKDNGMSLTRAGERN